MVWNLPNTKLQNNKALDAEPPVASFLKSKLIGGGPVNAADYYEVLGCASGSHHCFCFFLCLHRLIHREVPVAVSIE
jgi:hypothetical protein